VKVALAARLRAETTMRVGWIAERLAMSTRGYLNHLLYRRRKLGGDDTISRTDPFAPDPFARDPFAVFQSTMDDTTRFSPQARCR